MNYIYNYNCNLKYLDHNSCMYIFRSLVNKFIELKKKRITTKLESILFNIKIYIIYNKNNKIKKLRSDIG